MTAKTEKLRRPLRLDSTQASSSTQAATKAALRDLGFEVERADFWSRLEAGHAYDLPSKVVVVANLNRVAKSFSHIDTGTWAAGVRVAKPYIIGLVQGRRDYVDSEIVEHILKVSDSRVTVCELRKPAVKSLTECLARAAAAMSPHGIVAVNYSDVDRTLWLLFGDGVRRQLPWSALGLDDRKPELRPETVRPGGDPETVEVSDVDGGTFEIDSSSLRSLVDASKSESLKHIAIESAKTLGERLARAREAKKLTQTELEKRSGLTQEAISRMEAGRHWPRMDTLREFARGLGISVAELLGPAYEPLPTMKKAPQVD